MRAVVGLVGLFNLALGLGFLIDPAQAGLRFFLLSLGTQGLATMRADFTAFFVTGGTFALIAAWRAWRTPLLVPLLLLEHRARRTRHQPDRRRRAAARRSRR